jgi:hypothetical protein
MKKGALTNLSLVCEGETDKRVLAALIHRILRAKHSDATVTILAAGGRQSIPKLVRALERQMPPDAALGMVVDSDGDPESTEAFLSRDLDLRQYSVIIAHPSLESWFGLTPNEVHSMLKDPKQIQSLINRADLDRVAHEHPEFCELLKIITEVRVGPVGVSSEALFPRNLRTKAYREG